MASEFRARPYRSSRTRPSTGEKSAVIAKSLCYSWSKEFQEAGKKRLAGDSAREAPSGEVKDPSREARALKEVVAEPTLEIQRLKISVTGNGDDLD